MRSSSAKSLATDSACKYARPTRYEHWIGDSRDYTRHVDYVHYNPVKHGLVKWPKDWAWSTFHRWVKAGEYDLDWCGHVEMPGDVYLEPDAW